MPADIIAEIADSPVAGRLSLTGRPWHFREADERMVRTIAQKHTLPDVLAQILASRGIAVEDIAHFLSPSLKQALPDPSHLLDMDAAAARVAAAVVGGERVAIFGDYDVDGATSSALLLRYFRALGMEALVHIPDRIKEGYGPNSPALLALKAKGVSLVLTVDCGTLAFEPLAVAHAAGLDVIVIDHHIGEARKPRCFAVVNPNRLDERSAHGQMAAVGVAFLLVVAVNRALRQAGWFAEKHLLPNPPPEAGEGKESPPPFGGRVGRGTIPEPDIRRWLDIVALGTICDVVPLTGVNRALVTQGLKVMAARGNPGICAVLASAGVSEKPECYHAGFVIGPRINAGGRVGRPDLGVRLLATDDAQEAQALAQELEHYNAERKAIEALVQEAAHRQAEALAPEHPVLVVAGAGWHPGVIGIVAGRLKERFHRPVAVIALDGGIGKASARSVAGMDFGAAVIAAREAGLLLAGGGHAMAAGFTVEEACIPALTEFFHVRFQAHGEQLSANRRLMVDGHVSIQGANVELAQLLERLGPFGQGNPQVRLAVRNVVNLKPELAKEQHVRALFICRVSNARLSGIAFRAVGTKLGDALFATAGKNVDIAGQLRVQEWLGQKKVSVMIEDVALVD